MPSQDPAVVLWQLIGYCLIGTAGIIMLFIIIAGIGNAVSRHRAAKVARNAWVPPIVTPDVRTEFERVVSRYDVISGHRCTVSRYHYLEECNGYHVIDNIYFRK